jgi:hypothetical protein
MKKRNFSALSVVVEREGDVCHILRPKKDQIYVRLPYNTGGRGNGL